MEEYYSEHPVANSKLLCVGPVCQNSIESVREETGFCDGLGYYLFVADATNPREHVEVLAKLASEDAAQKLSSLLTNRMLSFS